MGGLGLGWAGGAASDTHLLMLPCFCIPPPPGSSQIPGSIQVFSSYPGTIFSGDDFYILSSGLVSGGLVLGDPSRCPPYRPPPHR